MNGSQVDSIVIANHYIGGIITNGVLIGSIRIFNEPVFGIQTRKWVVKLRAGLGQDPRLQVAEGLQSTTIRLAYHSC